MEQIDIDNRFKVGDKVVVTKNHHNVDYYQVGNVLTIREVDPNKYSKMRYRAEFVNKPGFGLWVYNDDIEAYEEKTKKPAKYYVGQKVRLKETFGSLNKGDITKITFVDENDCIIPVKISLSDSYDSWIDASRFEVVKSQYPVIVITTDGKETKARLIEGKTVLREAIAKCHDNDPFDFETGAKLAFRRLYRKAEPEPSKPEVGKAYIIKSDYLNGFGALILKKGDIVTAKKITGNLVYFHGFSRTEKRFVDTINITLEKFSEKFEGYATDEELQ